MKTEYGLKRKNVLAVHKKYSIQNPESKQAGKKSLLVHFQVKASYKLTADIRCLNEPQPVMIEIKGICGSADRKGVRQNTGADLLKQSEEERKTHMIFQKMTNKSRKM